MISIPPYDAWAFASILSSPDSPAETPDRISAVWAGPAEVLAALPAFDRQAFWAAWLKAPGIDGDQVARAVAEADPDSPPPEATVGEEDDEWGPIWLEEAREVEPFPLDVLPRSARDLAVEVAGSVGCPVDFPAAACLAVAAGVIGRSASLMLKRNYFAAPCLWIGVVGRASDGKSPGVDQPYQAAKAIAEELGDEHKLAMQAWQDEPTKKGKVKRPPPRPRRVAVDDCTTEALVSILADNPRGLLQFKDELAGFLHGMDQYRSGGKGSDRPRYCSIWAGKPITIDRAKHEGNVPVYVPHPCLSLFGPLVPDNLKDMVAERGAADGFLDRFLFVMPPLMEIRGWEDEGVDDGVVDAWRELVRGLWRRDPVVERGRSRPHVVYMTGDARDAWAEGYRQHVAEMNDPEFPDHLRGPWGKLREYAGRLALVLTLMRYADAGGDHESVPDATPEVVRDAWRLVGYFKSHALKAYARLGGGPSAESPTTAFVLSWVRKHRPATFTVHDLKQARRTLMQEDVMTSLRILTRKNVIRPERRPDPRPKGGRPTRRYEVNPNFLPPYLVAQNPQNTRNPRSIDAGQAFPATSRPEEPQ